MTTTPPPNPTPQSKMITEPKGGINALLVSELPVEGDLILPRNVLNLNNVGDGVSNGQRSRTQKWGGKISKNRV